jgi:hypothetical protein
MTSLRVYVVYADGEEPMHVYESLESAMRYVENEWFSADIAGEPPITWRHVMDPCGIGTRWEMTDPRHGATSGPMVVEAFDVLGLEAD